MYSNTDDLFKNRYLDKIAVLYAPLENYLNDLIPLMLEHIWKLKKIKNTSYYEELVYTGWLSRLITLDKRVLDNTTENEIPGWPELKFELIKNFESCQSEKDLQQMVERNGQLVLSIIGERFDPSYKFPERQFCCWWYTIHEDETNVAVHLINAYQPCSPFSRYDHFVKTFYLAIMDAINKYPSIKKASCGSWLNNHRTFQSLWPSNFYQSSKVINVSGGLGPGVWGQYMTQNGGFHFDNARILKKTLKHPFPLIECSCSIKDLQSHLDKLISVL
jgi:hypothetical protein